jgi:hypothetical protein
MPLSLLPRERAAGGMTAVSLSRCWSRTRAWSHSEGCGNYLAQMRATIDALGSVPVETLSEEAADTLLAAFRRRTG